MGAVGRDATIGVTTCEALVVVESGTIREEGNGDAIREDVSHSESERKMEEGNGDAVREDVSCSESGRKTEVYNGEGAKMEVLHSEPP